MQQWNFYVSPSGNDKWSGLLASPSTDGNDGPFQTVQRARDAIRALRAAGRLYKDVTVHIRGGEYPITEPISFTQLDSFPTTYKAYGEETPVFNGGVRLTDFTVETVNGVTAWTKDLPAVRDGKWSFTQLYVNDTRRDRPRLPKDDYFWIDQADIGERQLFHGTDTFQYQNDDIQEYHNIQDVDIVVDHYWIDERMPIQWVNTATRTVKSTCRSVFVLTDDFTGRLAKYYLDNVFEALTEPGQWYLDKVAGKLYYIPLPGETMDNTVITAPVTAQFITVTGLPESGDYVENLHFEGLTFANSDCRFPLIVETSEVNGYSFGLFHDGAQMRTFGTATQPIAGTPQGALHVPGVLYFEGAKHCSVTDCTIKHIGWYGIELGEGCFGNTLAYNDIYDTGAGGIKLGGSTARGSLCRRNGANQITDNHIYDLTHVYHGATGILSIHSCDNTISHNHIHDMTYTGISCGWIWGYAENVSKNNKIEKNLIHDLGKGVMSDMGGIYTLGGQPGTEINGNLIYNVEKNNYGGWGIYFDEGSSHIIAQNNICYNMSSQPFHQHYGRENTIRNNIFACGREGQLRITRKEDHMSVICERNIIITEGTGYFIPAMDEVAAAGNIISDLNLFWTTGDPEAAEADLEGWKALGQDSHSVFADPGIRDLFHNQFDLKEDSPAYAIGFKPIDMSDVGPRPRD